MARVPAYILAGGESSRFGSDKAMFAVNGVPLWQRVATALENAGFAVHLVGRSVRGVSIPELIEPEGPRHPLWGALHAIRHANTLGERSLFVAPCDLVDLDASAAKALLAGGRTRVYAKGQPLLASLTVDQEEWALHCVNEEESVQHFHDMCGNEEVNIGPLRNLNERPG